MNIFALVVLSSALGFGAGMWYGFGPRLMDKVGPQLERLKPEGRGAFVLYQLAVALVYLPLIILPFGLALGAPPYIASFFGIKDFGALMGA